MDDQKIQAYLKLINQLLQCPNGQESEILQVHQELLGQGLIEVMVQVAEQLQSAGNKSNAGWLQNLAMQLANAMNLTLNPEEQSEKSFQEGVQFFLRVIQCLHDNNLEREPLYKFLAANPTCLNASLERVIPAVTSNLLAINSKEQHRHIAIVIGTFGIFIQQFPLGPRAINLELAIASYQQSLQVLSREAMPVEWAQAMMNLANAYYSRIRGDRAQNIEDAIDTHQQSLQVERNNDVKVKSEKQISKLNNKK